MTERSSSGGAMTGATGDLTPDEIPDDLRTGERREIEDSAQQASVTEAQAGASAAPPSPVDANETAEADEPRPQSETRIGGDEVSSDEERF